MKSKINDDIFHFLYKKSLLDEVYIILFLLHYFHDSVYR